LGGVGVVPEVGILGAVVQLGKLDDGGIPVKDASSARRPNGRFAHLIGLIQRTFAAFSAKG
jgi:hypothetical protein